MLREQKDTARLDMFVVAVVYFIVLEFVQSVYSTRLVSVEENRR